MRLGLPAREFWKLTPRQLHVLTERHKEETFQQEFLLAQIAQTIHNLSGRTAKKMLAPIHFMPSQRKKVESQQRLADALAFHDWLDGMARQKGLKK